MEAREILLVCLMCFVLSGQLGNGETGDFDAGAFVKNIEQQVTEIADKAVQNYGNKEDLFATCQPQNCSRAECYPIASEIDDIQCVPIANTTYCSNTTISINANFGRGYVSTPLSSIDVMSYEIKERYTAEAICAQRELDSTFMNVNRNITNSSDLTLYATDFVNLYFGAIDGSFRFYPGREALDENCNTYDPRIRPWYLGAISVVKDLVILLDTGSNVVQRGGPFPDETALDVAKPMTMMLLQTLTAGDRATLIPFNESGALKTTATLNPWSVDAEAIPTTTNLQFIVPPDPTNSQPKYQETFLGALLDSPQFAGDAAFTGIQSSNVKAGLTEAFSVFHNGSPTNALKIVILITVLPDSAAAHALYQQPGSLLFVYDFGYQQDLDVIACTAIAYYEQLCITSAMTNLLLSLNSYFSFLARSRLDANNGVAIPFWQTTYLDANGLGEVSTVSYPAIFVSDGVPQLIGVAAIDIPSYGLAQDHLGDAINYALAYSDKKNSTIISTYPIGATISCTAGNNRSQSCAQVYRGLDNAVCKAPRASAVKLNESLCECASSRKSSTLLFDAGALTPVVLMLLMVAVICLIDRFCVQQERQPSSMLSFEAYSYDEIISATDDFDEARIIGKGAFGVVFRGFLRENKVAIKRLPRPADRADDFHAELKILGVARHPNLVELKGTCFRPTECFLVYELVEGGDLHTWLWPGRQDNEIGHEHNFLTWGQRKKIARGTARALQYLHLGLLPNGQIFHLDIKPRNILLEEDFNPKIADFGNSQLYEPGYTLRTVRAGTPGYIGPEVLFGPKPNPKLDVYGYGMVLLQLLSGCELNDPRTKPFLLQWAREQVEDGRPSRVLDKRMIDAIQEEYQEDLVDNGKILVKLAIRCLSDDPDLRPEMGEVLDSFDTLVPVPDVQILLSREASGYDGPETSLETICTSPDANSSEFPHGTFNNLLRTARSKRCEQQIQSTLDD